MEFFRTKWGTIVNNSNDIVPMDENSPLFREYEQWSKTNVVKPTDFMTEEDIKEDNRLKFVELDKLQFNELKVTDWYYIRKMDTGEEIPEDIIRQREEIRLRYNGLKQEII